MVLSVFAPLMSGVFLVEKRSFPLMAINSGVFFLFTLNLPDSDGTHWAPLVYSTGVILSWGISGLFGSTAPRPEEPRSALLHLGRS